MALEAGTRLGDYEIVAPLGAGGMGEVYRARDTRLGREVAIKLVLGEVAADPERRARFEREARVLASLNHPKIATLHGLFSEGDTAFLVMELVEGETLADRIRRGPIPVDEAVPLFIDIATGIGAAHEKGVLHRDLKPANIKIGNPDARTVKILDFGLAKAVAEDPATSNPALSASPTLTLAATQRGEILGTAAYMAPEQARGRPVDRRADVWAFGCCLYEALTGKRPFEGEDASVTLARVIEGTPHWDALPEDLPWLLRRVIERCLTKDPNQRLHDIGDARLELETVFEAPVAAAAILDSPAPGRARWAWAAAGFLLGALVLWGIGRVTGSSPPPAVTRSVIDIAPGIALDYPRGPMLAISNDGRSLAFAGIANGISQVYMRRMDELGAAPIPGTQNGSDISLSPDGRWLGFENPGTIAKTDLRGGELVNFTSALVRGTDWGPDGYLVWGEIRSGLRRLAASGDGEVETLTTTSDGTGHEMPEVLPDGNAILFTEIGIGSEPRIAVLGLEDRSIRVLLSGSRPRYSTSGHLVFGRRDGLWAVAFDGRALQQKGSPRRVVEDASYIDPYYPQFDLAGDGSLVYVRGADPSDVVLTRVDAGGEETSLELSGRMFGNPSLSPDGHRIAVSLEGDGGINLWIWDTVRSTRSQITFAAGSSSFPAWSPDGSAIAFWSDREGGSFWLTRPDGTGEPRKLVDAPFPQNTAWSPDGRDFLFMVSDLARTPPLPEIFRLTVESGELELLFQGPGGHFNPAVSPDGRWLAYTSTETGGNNVFVRPYRDAESGKWRVSNEGGEAPLWSHDGSQLYFVSRGVMTAVDVLAGDTFSTGPPRPLFSMLDYFRGSTLGVERSFDVDAENRFVVLRSAPGDADREEQIVLVQNFHEVLERLVPTD